MKQNISLDKTFFCMLIFTIPQPGNPRDKSGPSGPGVRDCLNQSCPGGIGREKSKVTFRCSCKVRRFLGLPRMERITYCP